MGTKKVRLNLLILTYEILEIQYFSPNFVFQIGIYLNMVHGAYFFQIKFIYSEKATKILQNLHLFLTGTSTSQKKVEISQKFCGLLRIYEL